MRRSLMSQRAPAKPATNPVSFKNRFIPVSLPGECGVH